MPFQNLRRHDQDGRAAWAGLAPGKHESTAPVFRSAVNLRG